MARVHTEACSSPSIHQGDSVMKSLLYGSNILSMTDLSLAQIQQVLEVAAKFKAQGAPHVLKDKIIAHCFFEPSTRTRLSFESATLRLGANVIGFSNDESLSIRKGETLHDTIRVIADYAD